MLANLFQPLLLARVLTSASASALMIVGVGVAIRVLLHYRIGGTSEGQVALERRSELVAVLIEVALAMTIVGAIVGLLAADRLAMSIRGAMCAYGVFDAHPWGFRSLWSSACAASAGALWIAIHRFDLELRRPVLTRLKFFAVLAVAPFVFFDFIASTAFALGLDLRVTASCCSTALDQPVRELGESSGAPRMWAVGAFFSSALLASGFALVNVRRPIRARSIALGVTSAIALVAAVPAITRWVAPHVYGTPLHLCPFCLLHGDAFGIGWILALALSLAAVSGIAASCIALLEKKSEEPNRARRFQARLASLAAGAWISTMCVAVAPFLFWMVESGGKSLFGDGM